MLRPRSSRADELLDLLVDTGTVNCQTLTPLAGAVNLFILIRTPSKPPGFIYIPAGDSGLFPATAEFLRITQDPNTESVARVSRARVRAGIRVSRFSPAAGELTSRS